MLRRNPRAEADRPATRPQLRIVLMTTALTGFTVLVAWIAFGALTASEPTAFVVAPAAGDPVAHSGNDQGESTAGEPGAEGTPDGPASATGHISTSPAAGIAVPHVPRVDPVWAARTAAATGIPPRALLGYAGAELAIAEQSPGCGLRWNTLAALGSIESAHGTHAGSTIGPDGFTRPGIFGIDLTGEGSARITDTDGGAWDGKADIDRAVGPLQFIPQTWETWGADGNGDGIRDPQQIDDAALAAAGYLCHHGDLRSPENWRTAIFAYNHLDTYVSAVARVANEYAGRAG